MDPKFADMHKLTLLYGNSISLYNESHKKFLHCFADAKLQEKIVDLAVQRLNCPNPLAEDLDWQFDISTCPNEADPDWTNWPISDLEQHRDDFPISIPKMEAPIDTNAILQWVLGSYRLNRAKRYITLQVAIRKLFCFLCLHIVFQSRREAEEIKDTFADVMELYEIAKQRPKKLRIYVRLMDQAPSDWDPALYGE